ncbi:MAG: hypothetical protein AB7K36_22830, partial [Chloroflexota bacterium]
MNVSLVPGGRRGLPLSAAPPAIPGPFSPSTIVKVLLGVALVAIVGGIPLPWMLAVYGGIGLLIAMMISPLIGLFAVLSAIPFSPTFGVEDAAFSI